MKTKGEKLAKKLGEMEPNVLTPHSYGFTLAKLGFVHFVDEDAVGSTAVSSGSTPENFGYVAVSTGKKLGRVALVGKGITYDTGGYSLKPSKYMLGMKFDMMGSASVLGAMVDGAPATAYLCVAENRVSSTALLPESVITYPDGTKVIVENTDAEGRLVLADGILLAIKDNAKVIVTVATLTGAIVAALGKHTVGAFVTDDKHWELVQKAFKDEPIGVWRMPFLVEDAKKEWKRPGNKISNCEMGGKTPGASYAASFLKHFAKDTPLIHLDIAGVADDKGVAKTDMVRILNKLAKLLDKEIK